MEPVGSHGLSAQRQCDVLMVSDFRFPGGTSRSLAEEITAQAQVGWATGLVHLNGPLVSRVTPVNPRIREQIRRGRARLLVGDRPIRTKVVVVGIRRYRRRQPASSIETEHAVLVANAPPIDIHGRRHYDPALVDQIARERFGVAPIWAPIGPLARGGGEVLQSDCRKDWVNIIDVDAWHVDRPCWRSDRPVIGGTVGRPDRIGRPIRR